MADILQIKPHLNASPLRYPGGKSKLYPFVSRIIERSEIENPTYVEPFAGGSGLALSLLYNNRVKEIVLNDYDKAIYSFWRAVLTQTSAFIEMIDKTPISVDEYKRQKNIYMSQKEHYSFELGFATFYLNRTNRSGIIKAGPIGGYSQQGNYKIDARFNKSTLIKRIQRIASYKERIHLYNQDVRSFINSIAKKFKNDALIYFDPPYFNKGSELYSNFFLEKDHIEIYDLLQKLACPWLVTYDDTTEIRRLYYNFPCWKFDLVYGVANSGRHSEIMYISDSSLLPDVNDIVAKRINLREAD